MQSLTRNSGGDWRTSVDVGLDVGLVRVEGRRLQIFSFTRRGKPYVFAACARAFMGPERGAKRRTRVVMTPRVGVLS